MTALQEGKTPLHWASTWGRVEVVQLLLERGAVVDARDEVSRDWVAWLLALPADGMDYRMLCCHGGDASTIRASIGHEAGLGSASERRERGRCRSGVCLAATREDGSAR